MNVLLLLALAVTQDTVVITQQGRYGEGPAERRAVSVYNASGTMRVLGRHTIGSDVVVAGDVAVLDGPLRVEGRITGDLVAINADVAIVAGGEVEGDVLILGGRGDISDDARIGGTVEQHTARVVVRLVDERLEIEGRDEPRVIRDRDRRLPRQSRWRPTGRASPSKRRQPPAVSVLSPTVFSPDRSGSAAASDEGRTQCPTRRHATS